MDTTALQQKIDGLQATVDADTQTLQSDTDALNASKKELGFANLVNGLEALSPDDVAALKQALNETDNTTGITVDLPSTAGTQA